MVTFSSEFVHFTDRLQSPINATIRR